jgi:hypothetical protein
VPNAKHVQGIEREWWKGEKKYIGHGIGRMFSEKVVKICSAVAKLLLLVCLRTNLSPQTNKKIALPTYRIIFCKNNHGPFFEPE